MVMLRRSELDRRILGLAVPALATLTVEPMYVLVDTAIVGRLGTVPLGGLALATTVITSLVWVFNFLAFATTSRVALLTGRGDHRGAGAVAAQALWLCALIGVPIGAVIAVAARPLATALGGEGEVLDGAVTYLRISAIGIPALLLVFACQGHLRGLSDTRTPLRVVLASNIANIILEVVLVYGFDTGLAGSAWGTVIAQVFGAAWLATISGRRVLACESRLRPDFAEMRPLLTMGRHLLVRTGALLLTFIIATATVSRVDPSTLGAHQIAMQIFVFLALAVDALAIAAQALVGTRLGAGDEADARTVAARTLRIGIITGVAIAVVLAALSPVLPRIFSEDASVVSRATAALLFLAVMQLPAAVAFVLDGALMGASDFGYLRWVTIGGLVAFLPFAVAVLADHSLGIAGVWIGLVAWMSARAGLSWLRFRGTQWTAAAT